MRNQHREPAPRSQCFAGLRRTFFPLSLQLLLLWLSGIVLFACTAYAYVGTLERQTFLAIVLMVLVIAAVWAGLLYRMIHVPLKRLITGAERAARGDLETPLDAQGTNEIGQLAAAIDRIANELTRAKKESMRWPQELEQKVAKKAEELSRAQRQMLRMERLASLGKLTAAVVHEINNPLSAILMYARLVERELPESGFPAERRDEIGRFLSQIQKDASRCGDVVRNLLLFAHAPEGDFAVQHVNQIIERSLVLVRHCLEMARIELDAHLLEGDDAITCDATQLQQAFVALLVNAVEAMPSGGRLTLRATPTQHSVCVDISDTGVSIAPEMLSHVFEPFVSTRGEEDDVGLGLPVIYGIVQRHGGTIEVESAAGKGTTFRLVLPRASSGPEPANT